MVFSNFLFAAICWLCALIFGAIAVWAYRRHDPMHFWSGSTVRPEEITDIPAYNRANGRMWMLYALCMAAAGVAALLSMAAGVVLMLVVSFPGLAVLMIGYRRIYQKYKSDAALAPRSHPGSKAAIAALILCAVSFLGVGAMLFYAEKEPVVTITDDCVQIKSMYSVTIAFSEINEVALLEKSMREIGVGSRTNGYGGLGETLRGNFRSERVGETLLFVQADSSPTIRIERAGKKDVYISFRNGDRTMQLYHEMTATIPLN